MNFIILLLRWGKYFITPYKNKEAFNQVWTWNRRNVAHHVSKTVRYDFIRKSCIGILIAFKRVRNGDPLDEEWPSSHLKGFGKEMSGGFKRKCQGNISKYVTVKAIVKFWEGTPCFLVSWWEKRIQKCPKRKATRKLKYKFLIHCTIVVYQQKTTARAQLQHKHVNERVTRHLHQIKLS